MTLDVLLRELTTSRWDDPEAFAQAARTVLAFQREANPVYSRYCKETTWNEWSEAPHLPVDAFKHVPVTTFPPEEAEHVFQSSGTGHGTPSTHYVRRLDLYEQITATHFEAVLGSGPFTFVAHLPGYAENGRRSSLLYMVDLLIRRFGDDHSGFFLDDPSLLDAAVAHSRRHDTSFLLFGAAFGLLDLLDERPVSLPDNARVIETGGMKTYRREIGRDELHARLAGGFGVPEDRVWSEYGMCELMSQCYTRGGHVFYPPPWMRFRIVDPERPSREVPSGTPGVLALFDLGNVYTASALLTEDRAVRAGDGFRVLGRLSGAQLRGCNFLVESGKQ